MIQHTVFNRTGARTLWRSSDREDEQPSTRFPLRRQSTEPSTSQSTTQLPSNASESQSRRESITGPTDFTVGQSDRQTGQTTQRAIQARRRLNLNLFRSISLENRTNACFPNQQAKVKFTVSIHAYFPTHQT